MDLDTLEISWAMDVKAFIVKGVNPSAQEIYTRNYFSKKKIIKPTVDTLQLMTFSTYSMVRLVLP